MDSDNDTVKPTDEVEKCSAEQEGEQQPSVDDGGAPSTSQVGETSTAESAGVTEDPQPPKEKEESKDSPEASQTQPSEESTTTASPVEDKPDEDNMVVDKPPPDEQPTSHVYDVSWSKLSKDEIVDKIKGIIYGQAIGDAFGLATEFLNRKAARKYYKTGPSGYEDIIQDFHRSRWDKGDWTDDTDQMLLILQMINENKGRVDKVDFANRIYNWMRFGFKELGDQGGMGIGMTVHRTLTHPNFLKDPHDSAKEVWEMSGRYLAANGAIMRTSILGVLNFNDIPKVVANTTEICKVTHADPRCAASCIAVTTAIAMILKGDYNINKKEGLKELVEVAMKEGMAALEHKDQEKEMKTHMNSTLDGLKLDEHDKIGYTFKALGAGFYGLRHSTKKKFRDIILEVIMEAGDADSNASVCGALVGCVVGFKNLPEDLLQFPNRAWLDGQVDNFLRTIGLKD